MAVESVGSAAVELPLVPAAAYCPRGSRLEFSLRAISAFTYERNLLLYSVIGHNSERETITALHYVIWTITTPEKS